MDKSCVQSAFAGVDDHALAFFDEPDCSFNFTENVGSCAPEAVAGVSKVIS